MEPSDLAIQIADPRSPISLDVAMPTLLAVVAEPMRGSRWLNEAAAGPRLEGSESSAQQNRQSQGRRVRLPAMTVAGRGLLTRLVAGP